MVHSMSRKYRVLGVVFAVALSVFMASDVAYALEVPVAPPLDRPIVDRTATLSDEQITALSTKLQQARQSKNIQLGILMIPTLENEALETYSLKVARQWGVGSKDRDNGVLLLIVKDDRRVRIEVGRGQEGDFTDAQAGRVIRNTLTPAFRDGQYYKGIDDATTQIVEAASGNPDAIPQDTAASGTGDTISTIFFLILFFLIPFLSWIGAILGRSKSWWAGGVLGAIGGAMVVFIFGIGLLTLFSLAFLVLFGLIFDYNVSKNYKKSLLDHHTPSWWAGGGLGGFGGGSGGGGFGGGGFGGGGASGSW